MEQVLNLSKGQSLCLDKSKLERARLGLGWKEKSDLQEGDDFDLDSCALLMVGDTIDDVQKDFIFPEINENHVSGAVNHGGDNVNGGDGINPDEYIDIDFTKIPAKYDRIAILVSIYKAEQRNQNFGLVDKSFATLANADDNTEIARIDIDKSFDLGTSTAVLFGSFLKDSSGNWHFKNETVGFPGGLTAFFVKYGVKVTGG